MQSPESLAEAGLCVFPVVAGTKRPCIVAWEEQATTDPERIAKWRRQFPACNWAVAAGPSGLSVLDVDVKKGGADSLADLDIEQGMPLTLAVNTPSGGQHLYFKARTKNRVRFRPGLDIRSVGGYVLCPGSEGYEAFIEAPIVDMPSWLLALVGSAPESEARGDEPTELDNPQDIVRARQWLATAEVAVEGQGGDDTTFRVACQVRDFGLSKEQAVLALAEVWNPRCLPPWDEADLAAKVENAAKYSQKAAGSMSVSATPFQIEKLEHDGNSPRHIQTVGHVATPREWVVEDWIPSGAAAFTLLAGEGATGKSLAALQLALAVSSGTDWLGLRVTQQPVLFVTCEDDDDELDRRVFAVRRNFPFAIHDGSPCYLWSRSGRPTVIGQEENGNARKGEFFAILDLALGNISGPKLLILDTVADIFAGSENNRSSVTIFLKQVLGELTRRHQATCLLVAHPSKAKDSQYSGSTAWSNSVRNRLFLKWQDEGVRDIRALSCEKANYTPMGGKLYLRWENGVLVPVAAAEVNAALETAVFDAIADAAQHGTPYGSVPQAGDRYIGKAKVRMDDGRQIKKELVMQAYAALIEQDRVEVMRGQKHGNGIYPKGSIAS